MQEKTKRIIKEDYERVQAFEKVFGVEMPKVGPMVQLPVYRHPFPGW